MDVIFNRRSIRKYTDQPVSKDIIEYFIKCGLSAPTANNFQPCHFIVITDREKLDEITTVHPYAAILKHAPLAILVCGDLKRQANPGYLSLDCAAATENILLAVTAKKLGAVWLGVYPREERMAGIKKIFHIPDHILPAALISIGYPAEEKSPKTNFDMTKVKYNTWTELS